MDIHFGKLVRVVGNGYSTSMFTSWLSSEDNPESDRFKKDFAQLLAQLKENNEKNGTHSDTFMKAFRIPDRESSFSGVHSHQRLLVETQEDMKNLLFQVYSKADADSPPEEGSFGENGLNMAWDDSAGYALKEAWDEVVEDLADKAQKNDDVILLENAKNLKKH